MTDGVWLEVALNGPWTRQRQPHAPVTRAELVDEALACADAGAAIVHLHAYDDSGRPREAYDLYAPVVEEIRSRRDVICYPTVPMGDRPSPGPAVARARYAVVEQLARAGLIEWSVVDPGSVTLATTAELAGGGTDDLRDAAMSRGGHLRVGLEDAPLGCTTGNAELVARAARAVEAAGRRLASAPEIRRTEAG